MKKIITSGLLLCSMLSFGQIDIESILDGNTRDVQRLLRGYVQPFTTGFGNGINGGWYNTAKAHKFLGIDIAVIANAAIVPSSGETFTFNNADYTNIKLDDTSISSAQLPTIAGSQDIADRPLLAFVDEEGNKVSPSISSIPGAGLRDALNDFNAVPSAMVQVGVGLFKNTDLKVRFVPKQTGDEYEGSVLGFGIMHDLKQWIPFVKRLPFDVSAFAGFQTLKFKYFFSPESNQNEFAELNTTTRLFQLIASKKLSIFTLYGGVGTSSYKTDTNLFGFQPSDSSESVTITAPNEGSSVRANIGLRVKLLIVDVAAEYAKQEYDVFSVRAGINIR